MPSWHLLMSWGAHGAMGELKSPRAAPPAFHHSPVVVGWCGAPTGGRCPVFSATALQDPGLQLAAPPRSLLLVRVRSCPFCSFALAAWVVSRILTMAFGSLA